MHGNSDAIFKIIADPTRRVLFERPADSGEQTVRVLTGHAGVSEPAVSTQLGPVPLIERVVTGLA